MYNSLFHTFNFTLLRFTLLHLYQQYQFPISRHKHSTKPKQLLSSSHHAHHSYHQRYCHNTSIEDTKGIACACINRWYFRRCATYFWWSWRNWYSHCEDGRIARLLKIPLHNTIIHNMMMVKKKSSSKRNLWKPWSSTKGIGIMIRRLLHSPKR